MPFYQVTTLGQSGRSIRPVGLGQIGPGGGAPLQPTKISLPAKITPKTAISPLAAKRIRVPTVIAKPPAPTTYTSVTLPPMRSPEELEASRKALKELAARVYACQQEGGTWNKDSNVCMPPPSNGKAPTAPTPIQPVKEAPAQPQGLPPGGYVTAPTAMPTAVVPSAALTEGDKYALECTGSGGKWDGRICVFPGGTHGPETTPTEHPTEVATGPMAPSDIPKAPTPEPTTTPNGRGTFAPVTVPPTPEMPTGTTVMVPTGTPTVPSVPPAFPGAPGAGAPGATGAPGAPGGGTPPWVEDILEKIAKCCEGAEEPCWYFKPGILKDECECESLDDPNSAEGTASRALKTYTEIAEGNPQAAEDWFNKNYPGVRYADSSAAVNWNALKIEQTVRSWVQSGLHEWNFARDWQLCWPVRAKYIRNDPEQNPGGVYLDGANMAMAALYPVRMLSDMAFEIASAMQAQAAAGGPSGAGSPAAGAVVPPVWPPGGAGGGWWTDSAQLKTVLSLANNIIANFLTIMRSMEAKTVRARDTLSICNQRLATGGPSEPTLVSGKISGLRGCCGAPPRSMSLYVGGYHNGRMVAPRLKTLTGASSRRHRFARHLGATTKPSVKNRRTDALAYALYYLSRYPAIYVYVPDDPSSISEIATTLNRHLEEVVSYTRNLREELRQLTLKIQDCEKGIAGQPPPVTPAPPEANVDFSGCAGTTSATGAVDPDAPISTLPDPYAEGCVIPGVNISTPSPSAGTGTATTTAAKTTTPWGWIAAAVAGAAIVARGGK